MERFPRFLNEMRSYKRLVVAVLKRAQATGNVDRIWSTPRVHRLLGELIELFGVKQFDIRTTRTIDYIEDKYFIPFGETGEPATPANKNGIGRRQEKVKQAHV